MGLDRNSIDVRPSTVKKNSFLATVYWHVGSKKKIQLHPTITEKIYIFVSV